MPAHAAETTRRLRGPHGPTNRSGWSPAPESPGWPSAPSVPSAPEVVRVPLPPMPPRPPSPAGPPAPKQLGSPAEQFFTPPLPPSAALSVKVRFAVVIGTVEKIAPQRRRVTRAVLSHSAQVSCGTTPR